MVASEWERLTVEASLLQLHLARAIERRGIEFGAPRDESAEPIPLWDVERKQQRLAQVQDVLRRAEVTTPGEHPVIGALLTLQDSADEIVVYLVVAPGEGDPTLNRVPIDSPFGQLLVRAKVDSWLVLKVPAGSRRMRVVKISYPRTSTLDSGERPPEGGFVAEWAAR